MTINKIVNINFMQKINIYYLITFFILIFGINASAIAFFPLPYQPLLMIGIAIQSLIVTTFFLLISLILERFHYHKTNALLIFLCWVLIVFYEGDLIASRFLAAPLFQFPYALLQGTGGNIAIILKACGVSLKVWIATLIGLLAFLLLWILFYRIINRYRKWRVSKRTIFSLLLLQLMIWALVDYSTTPYLTYSQHYIYQSYLPLRQTLTSPTTTKVVLPKLATREIESLKITSIEKKPPIFLFVLESVGAQYINETTTPRLNTFREENISFKKASPGGNATMLAWFSLFHSQYPLRWSQKSVNRMRPTGSLSLKHLKELGYQIHLYTSADLSFYQFKESIFAKNGALANTIFSPSQEIEAQQRDSLVVQELIKDIPSHSEEGHIYIIFLDSPHFEYSWPEEQTKFSPVTKGINLFQAVHTSIDREEIFNRYRNSLYHIDSLMGEFFDTSKPEDSIIIISGDHGEEFYDEGCLFHNSHLSQQQVEIPLYFHFGQKTEQLKIVASPICSQIDIFPTLLDYLGQGEHPSLDGESIFKKERWPFTITGKGNVSMTPYEFCIQNHSYKMILHSPNLTSWDQAPYLNLFSIKNTNDIEILEIQEIKEEFMNALQHPFSSKQAP